jgi:8-oxo-dGTP pyrophosphatase MutT (NUDIX family)
MGNSFELTVEGLPESAISTATVTLTENITKEELLAFPGFKTWISTLQENLALQYTDESHAFHKDPYTLRSIMVQSVDWFGPKVGFVKINAEIKNESGPPLPGIALLRGGSVAILMILRPKDAPNEKLVVLVEQARIPAGSLSFLEIPAGMLDGHGNLQKHKATEEIKEETGLEVNHHELIDISKLAVEQSTFRVGDRNPQPAVYPSPGGSDESINILLWEKEIPREKIKKLEGKATGNRKEGELIKVRVCKYEDLWKVGARDGKTLAAWALYEGLSKMGIIEKEVKALNETGKS